MNKQRKEAYDLLMTEKEIHCLDDKAFLTYHAYAYELLLAGKMPKAKLIKPSKSS